MSLESRFRQIVAPFGARRLVADRMRSAAFGEARDVVTQRAHAV